MLHAFTSSHSGGCNGCRFSAFISIFIISKCNTAVCTAFRYNFQVRGCEAGILSPSLRIEIKLKGLRRLVIYDFCEH